MRVLKFGGTSVGTVDSIEKVIEIIEARLKVDKVAVVFSALGGVTNRLIEIGNMASMSDSEYSEHLHSVEERHFNAIRNLIPVKEQSPLIAKVKGIFNEIEDLLRGISLIKDLSPRTLDLLTGFGERLSTTIISQTLISRSFPAQFLDARTIIRTNSNFGKADVDMSVTNGLIQNYFSNEATELTCVTGFIASDENGVTTTLGRGGSDYTASIIASALKADLIEIWTDVNGMMTADPRKVKSAFTIPEISYSEAMELSHFGAKVIYPPSLTPAFSEFIPVKVLNTFNVDHPGTLISKDAFKKPYSITGISSIDNISLINVHGNGMIGVAGVSAKVFTIMAENKISVILISQASSEHSICFAVSPEQANEAKSLIEEAFSQEIKHKDIDGVVVQANLSVIAIVGESMKSSSGTSGKLFDVLGQNGINVIAIAQGSSELNISVVIEHKNISKALNSIHERFFDEDGLTLNLFMVGPTGLIGKTLLRQIKNQYEELVENQKLELKVIGLCNSSKMLVNPEGINLEKWEASLLNEGQNANLIDFTETIKKLNLPYSIFIDNTASKGMVEHYAPLLQSNISIVTPNKVANSGSYKDYVKLQELARNNHVKFLYETNVGAGLPIINTLKGLIHSGDKIQRIEAVLSGTLAYLFNNFKVGTSFLDIVKEAKAKGFTEPDPREDLSGMDVARKILILAREIGLNLEPEDVEIEALLNEECTNAPDVEAFYEALERDNGSFEKRLLEAEALDKKLRYVATLENGKAIIKLTAIDQDHAFFSLAGSENIISFTTERYKEYPLVVKGPGAGAEVTAMGVFADIISFGSILN